jgi:U6 snRNA-associated Sm-like protein LSm1
MVALRDGRKLIGVLRAWDQVFLPRHVCACFLLTQDASQYANLVLQGTVERLIVGGMYCDIPRGLYIIRGENVLLLGEIVRCGRV